MAPSDLNRKVGDFISPVPTTLLLDQTVEEALAKARKARVKDKIFYFYVVDRYHHLEGIVSTRSLLLSDPQKKIKEIYEAHILSITANHTLKEAMEMLAHHRLLALPVVDEHNELLGTVDIQLYLDEVVDMGKAKRSSTDLFHVLGLTLEEGKASSPWELYKNRMPWLCCNMIGGLLCAVISRVFELVLLEVITLALFIPLVLTLSESVSMQSMSYSLQILHRPKISGRRILRRITSEWKMVLLLALTCGASVGLLSLLWGDGWRPGVAIAAGIMISVTITGVIGAAIPLILHQRKLDPKVAAGPVVLMLADVITTTIYLGLSTLWLLHS